MLSKQLQDQIEQEAEANTRDFKNNNDYDAGNIDGYKEGYEVAGVNYAALYETALARAERAERALNLIAQMSDPGDHWVAVCKMKSIATDALTTKTGEDE
jgi:hypothetical protein